MVNFGYIVRKGISYVPVKAQFASSAGPDQTVQVCRLRLCCAHMTECYFLVLWFNFVSVQIIMSCVSVITLCIGNDRSLQTM